MSQYGIPFDQDEPWVCGALDLSIETLTGTAFEIRVAPTDTIMSIKAKIQRFEGIPVSQQHLLYNSVELDNSASVQDYAIQNGSTLKLILSLRGGPVSTRRLPSTRDVVWRELEEWMNDNIRVDLNERLVSASRMTVLVFRDGDQVNLFRVIENEDGTYSPLSDSWSGSSLRNLFSEEDPQESARRMKENSVTMGKMQELMENMKKISITKKDRRTFDSDDETTHCGIGEEDVMYDDDLPSYLRNPAPSPPPENSKQQSDFFDTTSESPLRPLSFASEAESFDTLSRPVRPPWKPSNVNEGASCSSAPLNNARSSQTIDVVGDFTPVRRPITIQRNFLPGLRKARKEAENIIRLQSKSLSVVIDSPPYSKRSPLPELRRTHRLDRDPAEKKPQNNEELREKTASRMSTSRFAIVEEENDMTASGPGICSSQSSLLALPSSDDVVVSFPSISRDRVSTSVGPSRFRVSHYVVDNGERPKSTPSQLIQREKLRKHILTQVARNEKEVAVGTEPQRDTSDMDSRSEVETESEEWVLQRLVNEGVIPRTLPLTMNEPTRPLPPPVKKRPRCLACRKRLNITNTHTCRCGGVFCSIHRYSEAHDCHFDYKEEGKTLLSLANPLVTAPKLPKI